VNEVVVMVGLCVRKREAGEGAGRQKPRNRAHGTLLGREPEQETLSEKYEDLLSD
jgi:hypothetical protein